jgi:hypothetical protein
MASQKETVERRKHKRFKVPIGSFVVLGPHSGMVGRIIDISMGGLAFRHVDKEEPPDGFDELDVFHENDFRVKHVPCESISHIETYESPFGSFTIRESALRFGDMTPYQMFQLEQFIHNYTIWGWFEPTSDLSENMAGIEDGKCYKKRIEGLCRAEDIGLDSFVQCLEENPHECPHSTLLYGAHYCKHPLRVDIAKKLKK